ncbi:sugar ABC transporter ATP-binding protein [Sporanaerobium hydrogeniformans]|uniref:Sugar ABC transporter ATP-binding protein n=1 Tax=Sporanaerobium hydrogeniformans TaxID=3072179 RepID=A0AC61D7Z5_9FIRM|nr:sugar ABC transporter ATP-binding protein [Sporanaerobium hydrogeniformans]PHV69342.1 sugar ABC transporter ATP-binding protein [Sporanaerobium hydrogeniformans]
MELLKMSNISKSFFGVQVLSNVNLTINKGEVHALLGENGAGKSTLMNILAGVYTRDSGSIIFDGKELIHTTIKEAEDIGIGFVHQELNIFNDLKVYENIFLGKELINGFRKLEKKAMINETRDLMQSLGVDIDPLELAGHLDTSKKQLLEIAKVLHSNAKLIILDEPTTALNNEEIKKLFGIIKHLKKQGKSFIFISHKMPEIFQISDRYTVLRNGSFIKCQDIKHTNPEEITRYMVGESYNSESMYETRALGEVVLELKNLSGEGFSNINLSVKKGEIIGLTGLQGAGCSEVIQTIFGVMRAKSGEIKVHGKVVTQNDIQTAMKNKIAMVAANRKENSIIPDMSLLENIYISEHVLNYKKQHIVKQREINKYTRLKELLNIKANHYGDAITSLSGGNQQKVILARWLNTKADIILFDNPTQGIDVGAKSEIYKLILELSKEGKTVIMNTLEIPEIQKIADRCIVFYHGGIEVELHRNEINEENVMLHATHAVHTRLNEKEEENDRD